VDEVGRGPLAGPVVAAAVIIDRTCWPRELDGLDDSKQLTARRRESFAQALRRCARIGIGAASVHEIDTLNILQASLLAMTRAVTALGLHPDMALIDGNKAPTLSCATRTVIGGDGLSLSIAAASVIAKVTRDRAMASLARRHDGYGWERNAGYGTEEHRDALRRLGVTPHHRQSFAPVRALIPDAGAALPKNSPVI
jgi:ribonuclease HII